MAAITRVIRYLNGPAKVSGRRYQPITRLRLFLDSAIYILTIAGVIVLCTTLLGWILFAAIMVVR